MLINAAAARAVLFEKAERAQALAPHGAWRERLEKLDAL